MKLFVAWCHCPRMGGATVGASYPVRQPHSRTISTMGLANDLEYELINTQSFSNKFNLFVGLDHRHAHVVRPTDTVKITRAHESAKLFST